MKSAYINTYPWRSLGYFLLAMLCLFLTIVGSQYVIKPEVNKKDEIIAKSLSEAASIFKNHQIRLLRNTRNIAIELQKENTYASSIASYHVLKNYANLWGAVLVKNGEPVAWNGFSAEILRSIEEPESREDYILVKKQNNTLFWVAHVAFSKKNLQNSTVFHLYTAERILQKNALRIGREKEYHFLNAVERSYHYPVAINIFEATSINTPYEVLTNTAGDSVGVVYAAPDHFQQLLQNWQQTAQQWRSFFGVFFFVAFLLFITFWLDLKSIWQNLFIRLLFIAVGWFFFSYLSISTRWLPELLAGLSPAAISSYQRLFAFSVHAVFLFLLAYAMHYTLNEAVRSYRSFGRLTSIIGGAVAGATAMLIIFAVFQFSSSLIHEVSFSLLTLQIVPSFGVIFLYLSLGLMLWAVVLLILTLNRFIFRACRDHYKQSFLASLAAFIISFGIANFYLADFSFNWSFYTGFFFFMLIGILSFIYFRYPPLVNRSSMLRNTAAVTLILAITGTPLIYFGELHNQDEALNEIAEQYSKQNDEQAKKLVKNVLNELQLQFHSFTLDSLAAKKDFIQAAFSETINTRAANIEGHYKLHFQFVTQQGERVASYSNALDVPQWVNYFNPDRFYTTISVQGIGKNNIMPVIQQPVLVNQESYETFYRGWIPLYSSTESKPVAWILGSVYRKRFDIKKPMQSLVASYNVQSRSEPVVIQNYDSNGLTATVYKGAGGHFPIYEQLPAEVIVKQRDSLFYYNSSTAQYSYRNLIVRKRDNNVLKVSAIVPDFNHILFTLFKFHLSLLLTGLIALFILQLIKTGKIELVKRNMQFQYRILDSFLLATLAFLILIIAGTYFTLKWQNENYVKRQLYDNLESIHLEADKISALKDSNNANDVLQSGVELQTDASFYASGRVVTSTTPQIYHQHLLPSALPFPVYFELYKNKKRRVIQPVMLSGQQFFMGYRLLSSNNNESKVAVAIPAFAQSPVYKSRLLETSSYLVLFYVIIFSSFIAGAIFISHRLTKPLYKIRRGLYQISKGDLDTTIPVESKDEIGILAASYNRMVERLKKLQEELAKSEREAAWKEVAREAAHEIKNPLTPMKLNIQHLRHQASSGKLNGEELKNKIIQITQNILVQIDALNTIAFNFLSYSKTGDADFKEVEIDKLVMQIAALHKNMDHTKLEINIEPSFAVVNGVEEELNGVIFNLIKNAYEASGSEDVVTVTAYGSSESYVVKVHNTGNIIPEDIREDIFKPNFSTKSNGTGLGLAICKKVVDKHKGSIRFESNKEEGTTFIVVLPLAKNAERSLA